MSQQTNDAGRADAASQRLVVVRVQDAIEPKLTARAGARYQSPPQTHEQAMTLVQLLLGCATDADGRRSEALERADRRRATPGQPERGTEQMRRRIRSRLRWLTAGAIGAVALACAPTGTAPSGAPRSGRATDRVATDSGPATVVRPRPYSCHARASGVFSLPDPRCTPGAIDPAVTQSNIGSTICREGFTARERPPESVSEAEKQASMAAYGDAGPLRGYEYDHLVPIELGGAANDPHNLWPEPGASPNPKDSLEGRLRELVCRGRISLGFAQRLIARNWIHAGDWVHQHDPAFRWRVS